MDDDPNKWSRLPKISFNSRLLKKRIKKAQGATVRHAHKFVIKRWGSVRESQRHITIWALAMGVLIAATGLQLMWYQQSYRTVAPLTTGTYAEATLGPVNTLNPIFAESSAEQSAAYLMFSSLLRYDGTGHLGNDIATNVAVNDAKTIYTVSIRPDVKWHDGIQLTASDVVFTVGLFKNSTVRSTIGGWKEIGVKAINDITVEFSMNSSFAAFQHLLTFPIVPQHILGSVAPANIRENNYSQKPVGSGPFRLSFVQNVGTDAKSKVVYMLRNDKYYGGTPKLAKFQLHIYNDTDSIVRALKLNEVNAAADLSPTDVGKIKSADLSVTSESVNSGVYALLNTTSATLSNANLRKALQLATDTSVIRASLPSGTQRLDLPLVNRQLTGDLPTAPAFDAAGAGRILDTDGWALNADKIREKDGKQLKLSIVVLKDAELEKILDILVGQWRAVGVAIETRIVDPTDVAQDAVQGILQPRNFDVLLYRLNIGADPDVYAYWHSSQANASGSNFSNYSNAISDAALSSARVRFEPDLRNAKYITFARQWLIDVPAIGLYQSTAQYVRGRDVRATSSSAVLISSVDRYSDILDWSVGTRSVYKTP